MDDDAIGSETEESGADWGNIHDPLQPEARNIISQKVKQLKKKEKKATFSRIKEHLERVYQRKFGYGTVVQLCVARNKRRLSASQYKGLAKVTCRRARKGFTIRYNPDKHWSSVLYRALDALQLKDGTDIININRDE